MPQELDYNETCSNLTKVMLETMGQNMILLGSTFRIKPSKTIAMNVRMSQGSLTRISTSPTQMDSMLDLLINAYPEDFMKVLMSKLKLEVPQFKIQRSL